MPTELVERLSLAVYRAPSGTPPAVPEGETADQVEINISGMRFVWRRHSDGAYRPWSGPIGWLADHLESSLEPVGAPVRGVSKNGR